MSKLYIKNIDGTYSPYNPVAVSNLDIVQETGDSLTSAMSQKAVTDELTKKQDTINDLDSIRSGAAKGATALQSETDPVYIADKPNIALKSEIPDISGLATKEEVAGKQDTISDLASIKAGAAKGATALQSYTESDPIYIADKPNIALKSELSGKQDTITDLATIRSNAAKGATALQSYTETDPIYTADKPSIALKSEIPDVSGKADKTLIVTETEGSASYSIVPNKLIKLGTLASSVTLSLNSASEEAGVANIYDFIFTTPANAPSIT